MEVKRTDTASRWTEAVRPAALDPFPDVYTAIGATCEIRFNLCFQLKSQGNAHLFDKLEQLTFCCTGITKEQDIEIAS